MLQESHEQVVWKFIAKFFVTKGPVKCVTFSQYIYGGPYMLQFSVSVITIKIFSFI